MSDTPETDNAEKHAYEHEDDMTPTVKSDFARKLERERNELREMILNFCEGENWTIQRWQDQEHVNPLFNMAEKIKDNKDQTNDK